MPALGLLGGRVRQDDSARGDLLLLDGLDDHTIAQGLQIHRPSRVQMVALPHAPGRDAPEPREHVWHSRDKSARRTIPITRAARQRSGSSDPERRPPTSPSPGAHEHPPEVEAVALVRGDRRRRGRARAAGRPRRAAGRARRARAPRRPSAPARPPPPPAGSRRRRRSAAPHPAHAPGAGSAPSDDRRSPQSGQTSAPPRGQKTSGRISDERGHDHDADPRSTAGRARPAGARWRGRPGRPRSPAEHDQGHLAAGARSRERPTRGEDGGEAAAERRSTRCRRPRRGAGAAPRRRSRGPTRMFHAARMSVVMAARRPTVNQSTAR